MCMNINICKLYMHLNVPIFQTGCSGDLSQAVSNHNP